MIFDFRKRFETFFKAFQLLCVFTKKWLRGTIKLSGKDMTECERWQSASTLDLAIVARDVLIGFTYTTLLYYVHLNGRHVLKLHMISNVFYFTITVVPIRLQFYHRRVPIKCHNTFSTRVCLCKRRSFNTALTSERARSRYCYTGETQSGEEGEHTRCVNCYERRYNRQD